MSVQQQNLSPTQEIYKKISKFVPEAEWKIHAPLIERINKIKKEKNSISPFIIRFEVTGLRDRFCHMILIIFLNHVFICSSGRTQ